MSGILLCCRPEGINPLLCARGSWGGDASVPVVSPELQAQEISPLTSFFCYSILLPTQGVVPAGSISLLVPIVTDVCRGPYRGAADGGSREEKRSRQG